jgi:hypothetical protein
MTDPKGSPRPKRSKKQRRPGGLHATPPEQNVAATAAQPSTHAHVAICLALCLATVAVYGQTFHHGYVYYDDGRYVYDNPLIRAGLTTKSVVWAIHHFFEIAGLSRRGIQFRQPAGGRGPNDGP